MRESVAARLRRLGATLRGALPALHVRSEIGWVLFCHAVDFVLQFALLKLLTNGLGKQGFGEYNLAETALVLLFAVLLVPIYEPFIRQYHAAREHGYLRSAGMLLFRWYAVATAGVVVAAALASDPLAREFQLGRATVFAAGLAFAFDRWRILGLEVRNQRRERRPWALWYLLHQLCLVVAVAATLASGSATAAYVLFAQAAVAAAFALPNGVRLVREVRAAPAGQRGPLAGLVPTFGLPFAALLVFQWLQSFSDRYAIKGLLDAGTVGLYVAAYQTCGIPYQLLLRVFHTLLAPIAYQRAGDGSSPARLWPADRLLLVGIATQAAVGLPLIAFYAGFGADLIRLLTNDHFVVTTGTVVLLTIARFLQAIAQSLQPVFSVHQRIGRMLGFRVCGGLLSLVLCAWATHAYGMFGAALGSALAFTLYALALALAPGGVISLVRSARAVADPTPRG